MGALETWPAHAEFAWHYFLNFSAGIHKLDCDRKASLVRPHLVDTEMEIKAKSDRLREGMV